MVESSTPVTSNDVARHYDQLDRFYREIWGDHVHHGLWRTGGETPDQAVRALAETVIARAGIGPGMAVCDLGCGYGATSRMMAQEHGAAVTGLTVSAAQRRHAQEAAGNIENPRFLLEDWLHNQQPSNCYDALVAIESTEHMADKERVFREVQRVLKAGGRMVVCAWVAAEQPKSWQNTYLLEPICREGRMPGLGTETDYRRWIMSSGLRILGADDVSILVERTWPICAWRFITALFRRPHYLRFLLDRRNDNRVFALTMLRLWCAYRTQAMRYLILTAEKPDLS